MRRPPCVAPSLHTGISIDVASIDRNWGLSEFKVMVISRKLFESVSKRTV